MIAAAWPLILVLVRANPERPLVRLKGADFAGGAAGRFGSVHFDMSEVNYVYARPTGEHSRMTAVFDLPGDPASPLCLHLQARDDDAQAPCPIEVTVNGKVILRGPSPFPANEWAWRRWVIADGILRAGRNEIVISNTAEVGTLGMPPWFMVARGAIASGSWDPLAPAPVEEDFFVRLPEEVRELPEPLPPGRPAGFAVRGIKGWNWRPDQYLAEIPVLAKYRMNFLMNCYLSMFDTQREAWNSGRANRWWEPLPEAKKKAWEEVVRACRAAGIDFCFAMNPNLASPRPLEYRNPQDLDALWQHYAWMQGLGVTWFSICLDDITHGIDAKGQAHAVNEIFRRLRAADPGARMVFCPTYYWGVGEDPQARTYLADLATELHPEVYVFWTGPSVVPQRVPRTAAEAYRRHVRHRLFLWDNYPVNDAHPTLHLGPLTGRDPDLGTVVDGYMANPMCPQNEINRIPLLTIADYTYNPVDYDPGRSIGQAIVHLAETAEQRRVLRDLVEMYPGMLLAGKGTSWNPVRECFGRLMAMPHSGYVAGLYVRHAEDVLARLTKAFPDRFADARETLASDVRYMRQSYNRRLAR